MGSGWGKSSEVQVVGWSSCTQQAPTVPVSLLPYHHCIAEYPYGLTYIFLWRIHVLGLVYKCLDMKNNFPPSSVSLSLCGFQLQTLGKFARETSLMEVALCQQYLALWVMAGFFRRVQVTRLGAQFLLCLVSSLLLAPQHLCDATDD